MYYRADLFPILPQGSVYKDVDEVFYWKAAVKLFYILFLLLHGMGCTGSSDIYEYRQEWECWNMYRNMQI